MAKKKQDSKQENQQEVQKPLREQRAVWVLDTQASPKSTLDYEWPKFKSDKERIKYMSQHYKDYAITEVFKMESGVTCNVRNVAQVNATPRDLYAGQIVPMQIASISKNGVMFDNIGTKQNIQSSVNLWKYEKFRHFLPTDDINVKVISVTKDRVQVDPLAPMYESWLNGILQDVDVQKNINEPKAVLVKNLRLTRGGFMGKTVIPNVSAFVGAEYTVDAFIPGSQIVLNIENDFTKWEGKEVCAFVTNYINKPNDPSQMSLICSAKEYLKFHGDLNTVKLFKACCENNEIWQHHVNYTFNGKVTGIINSSKKCGVFVEIPELLITGMIPMKPEELVKYKPQMEVGVKLVDFEEDTYFDPVVQQLRHNEPYKIEDGILREVNVKPVLALA